MNDKIMNNSSLTDWDRIDALTDEEIDTSDIPPLDADFFANAQLRLPKPKQVITVRLDADIVEWFKSQGKGYQTRINAVLRMYVDAQTAK
jgi:uncharacterized protein (DUF4415 family)